MNVLNIQDIEREIGNVARRSRFPEVKAWLLTTARNYVINLDADKAAQEFSLLNAGTAVELPEWAQKDIQANRAVHVFNSMQPRRRPLWKTMETVVDWFNSTWDEDNPELKRLNRKSYESAAETALKWQAEIQADPYRFVRDRSKRIRNYADGYSWYRMFTREQFQREGNLMGHCFSADTLILTADGKRKIGDCAGKSAKLLTRTSVTSAAWVDAEVKSFGQQRLWEIVLVRHGKEKVVHATGGHRWFDENDFEKTTETLEAGTHLQCLYAKGDSLAGTGVRWVVKSVRVTDRIEEVFCAQVPGTQCFVLDGNILTGNCVGGSTYVKRSMSGQYEYYSLRDADNLPHVTMEVHVSGGRREALQIKGKENRRPVDKYQPYLVDIVTQPGWKVCGDSEAVNYKVSAAKACGVD